MKNFKYHATEQIRCGKVLIDRDVLKNAHTPQYALVYLAKGYVVYKEDGGKAYEIEKGDAFQRFPNKKHEVFYKAGTETHFIALPNHSYEMIKDVQNDISDCPKLSPGYSKSLVQRHNRLSEDLLNTPLTQRLKITSRIFSWLVDVHQKSNLKISLEKNELWLKNAFLLLSHPHNYHKELELIAKELNLTYASFRKKFKKATKLSPSDYRIQTKIERAQNFLYQGKSIKEIANLLKYSDSYAFSNQFKRYIGISPTEWLRVS